MAAQQVVECCAWDRLPPRFLIHDRDSRYGATFDRRLRRLGIEQVRTPFKAPRGERDLGEMGQVGANRVTRLARKSSSHAAILRLTRKLSFPGAPRLQAWRRLAERDALDKAIRLVLRPKDWMVDLTNALDLPLDAALEDVVSASHAPNLSQIARFTCNGLMQGTIKTFLVYILPVRVPVGRSEAQGRSWRPRTADALDATD